MQLLDTSNHFDFDSGLRFELGTECLLAVPFRFDVVDRELSDRDFSPFGQRFPLFSVPKTFSGLQHDPLCPNLDLSNQTYNFTEIPIADFNSLLPLVRLEDNCVSYHINIMYKKWLNLAKISKKPEKENWVLIRISSNKDIFFQINKIII
ncbi:hypothetical protein BpHYR1_038705 [Brachionus plicatilis]|uniref:Uncharacterized protein n=1 Tax=Brachionus plicatilis TaxID=10195 RepID=A0A3M7SA36_BRAPC|nr:hypothetical protein BpHYR1_038705 [Brachionus plicatilis]